jgi:hypothetical protein
MSREKFGSAIAFIAFFAMLAIYVFWGTWSLSFAPVMPDCPVSHPQDYVSQWCSRWLSDGKFVPGDIIVFLGSPYFWQELQYALALMLSGFGCAYFLRSLGLSHSSSFGAGLLLSFCGYWCSLFSAGHLGWFRWMTYGVFVFALIQRALDKNRLRHWVALGACIAWGSFYQSDLWLLFTFFSFIFFVYAFTVRFLDRKKKGTSAPFMRSAVIRAAIALAVMVLIAFPSFRSAITKDLAGRDKQIAEGQTVSKEHSSGKDARWIFVTNWSMPPEDTLEFAIPRIHGDTSCPNVLSIGAQDGTGVKPYTGRLGRPYGAERGNYRQHSLYVGFITCLLAIAGLVAYRRKGVVVFFALAAFLFWLCSLGRYCQPFYKMIFALPMGDYLRAPVKWHHLTEFSIVVLAGFGLEAIRRFLIGKGIKCVTASMIVFVVALIGASDLARINRLYCAKVDLSVVKAPNAAVEKINSLGKGKVLDFLEGGNGLISQSFSSRGIEFAQRADDADIRYAWVGIAAMRQNKSLASFLENSGFRPVGYYFVSGSGIKIAPEKSSVFSGVAANAVLLRKAGAAVKQSELPIDKVSVVTGIVSILTTLGVIVYLVFSMLPKSRKLPLCR